MSVELVDNCVVIPHLIDWSEKLQWSRKWSTQVVPGVTRAEDRSSGQAGGAYHKIGYRTLNVSLQERARFTARVLEALRSGRACSPFWGRQNMTTGGTLGLGVPFGQGLTVEQPYWRWQSGDYAIFVVQTPLGFDNRSAYINAGASGAGGYVSDSGLYDTGSPLTTISAIDRSSILDPPPEVVYQSGRVSTGSMVYTIGGWNLGLECKVHFHWAQIDHAVNLIGNRQKFKVTVRGDSTETIALVEVLQTAGAYDTSMGFAVVVPPDRDGRLTITFTPILGGNNTTLINAIEIHQKVWEVIQLTSGTEATQIAFVNHRLLGYWPVGSTVYPLLFGRVTVDDLNALTTRMGDTKITIEEPLGTGELAVNSCPAEVCYPDPPFDGGELTAYPYDPFHPPACNYTSYEPVYDGTGNFDVSGHGLGHSGTIPGNELNFMIGKALANLGQSGLPVAGKVVYWQIVDGGPNSPYWQSGSAIEGNWSITLTGEFLQITLVYCIPS